MTYIEYELANLFFGWMVFRPFFFLCLLTSFKASGSTFSFHWAKVS